MVKFFDGATIALFGGSFDPPHDGHKLVAKAALRALKVDFVWWLVSPQNPLKDHAPETIATRLEAVRRLADDRRFTVSAEEQQLGTYYAIDTVRALKARHPHVHFIWLIGADNLATMHRWKNWQALMREVPMAVYPRPGAAHKAGLAPAAQSFNRARLADRQAAKLCTYAAPAWVMLSGRQSTLASSALRQNTD